MLVWILLFVTLGVQAFIESSVVFPHGDFAFDPSLIHGANHSEELHKACVAVGNKMLTKKLDLIFLVTPHGVEVQKDFGLYSNPTSEGYATLGQDMHNSSFRSSNVSLMVNTDVESLHDLSEYLSKTGLNITEIQEFGGTQPFPLG